MTGHAYGVLQCTALLIEHGAVLAWTGDQGALIQKRRREKRKANPREGGKCVPRGVYGERYYCTVRQVRFPGIFFQGFLIRNCFVKEVFCCERRTQQGSTSSWSLALDLRREQR